MTYKKRNVIAVLSFFVALIICYLFAISTTLDYKNEYKNLVENKAMTVNLQNELKSIRVKQKYMDSILSNYEIGNSSLQNGLLTVINTLAKKNNLKIHKFNEPHSYELDNIVVNTYIFSLEGSYNDLIGVIYILEQKKSFGEIIHLGFEKKKNFRSGKFFLRLNVMLQIKRASIQI